MAKFKNTTGTDLSFSDGTLLRGYDVADVQPQTEVEKAWVKEGIIEEIKPAPKKPAKKQSVEEKTEEQ